MNEVVKDKRHEIDTACASCFYTLNKYVGRVKAYQTEQDKINRTYNQEIAGGEIDRIASNLRTEAEKFYTEVESYLSTIKNAALEMENLFDTGDNLQGALSVVKTLGDKAPSYTRFRLVNEFKGQKQALLILQAAFEASGIDPKPYFKGRILDVETSIQGLQEEAYGMIIPPYGSGSIMAAADFAAHLERFVDALGVDLAKKFQDITDISGAYMDRLRASAGLPPLN